MIKPKLTYERRVIRPNDAKMTEYTTKNAKVVKEPQVEEHKERGKIIKGDKNENLWMSNKFWK